MQKNINALLLINAMQFNSLFPVNRILILSWAFRKLNAVVNGILNFPTKNDNVLIHNEKCNDAVWHMKYLNRWNCKSLFFGKDLLVYLIFNNILNFYYQNKNNNLICTL